MHKTWHAFCRKFRHPKTEAWLYQGHDLITRVERWGKNRKDVRLLNIDDAYFSNSLLVLFEHGTPDHWMGLTALVISQCAPNLPVEFFLYPGDAQALFVALCPKRYRKTPAQRKPQPEELALRRKSRQLLRQHLTLREKEM